MTKAMRAVGLVAAGLVAWHAARAEEPPPAAAAPDGPIAALQQELKQQGFAPGPINGVMTEQTRQALAAYERRLGRPPASAGTADPVRRAQAALQRMGLLAGPADGVLGPATRDAIIRFEAARHLGIDPRVSDALLAALEAEGGASTAAATSAQSAAPAAGPAEPPPPPEATGRQALPPGVTPPPIH
jgi:peptidoglycan hydrolase-like protein with peptidoglycan-binding domain